MGVGRLAAEETVRPLVTIECADLPISTTFVVGDGIPRALWGTARESGAFARVSSLLAKEAFTARVSTVISGVRSLSASNLARPLNTHQPPVGAVQLLAPHYVELTHSRPRPRRAW